MTNEFDILSEAEEIVREVEVSSSALAAMAVEYVITHVTTSDHAYRAGLNPCGEFLGNWFRANANEPWVAAMIGRHFYVFGEPTWFDDGTFGTLAMYRIDRVLGVTQTHITGQGRLLSYEFSDTDGGVTVPLWKPTPDDRWFWECKEDE